MTKEPTRPTHVEVVIIGGGYGALLAAAVISHSGHDVLILGGDDETRGAAAEAAQLLRIGGQDIDDLLYGATRALRAAGAPSSLLAGPPREGTSTDGTTTSEVITCSRALLTSVVRTEVLARPGYGRETVWWKDARAISLIGDRGEVRGVVVRLEDGTIHSVTANLVVDADGAHAPSWLAQLGVQEAPQSVSGTAGSCATRVYGVPATAAVTTADIPLAVATAGNVTTVVAPIEGGRWTLSQITHGSAPLPTGLTFEDAASTFANPLVHRVISEADPLTDVAVSHIRRPRWCHFERVRHWPRRFVVLGDAVAAFGQATGQTLTSAEWAVRVLRNELAQGGVSHPTLSRRVQKKIAEQIAGTWPGSGLPGPGSSPITTVGSRFHFTRSRTYARAVSAGLVRRGSR
ncbi:hypothetical protein AB0469_38180 [Streptomyces sp. NPDC093801]|uniref:FAD-dependent oxidoreductase n=1 Tax=Streptomyces sp. NPDC093801 TaxID=3155203 RepID=UPI0034500B23